jgi:recombination protein RecA
MAAVDKAKKASVDGLLTAFKKDSGDDIGTYGGELTNAPRLPTGLFPLDLALGGGFPMGKASIIWGPESSCKTNIALMAVAMHQRIYPEKKNVFFDIEHSFDPAWAAKLGVKVDDLIVMRPSYAEQMVDQVEGLLGAEDIGVIIIDSLAALVTTQESNSSAEKANVGGSGLVTGKLVRKTTAALAEAEKQGYRPTLFYINQIRFKIGVMFGDPETMPGGNAPKYQAAISLRVYGKNVKDTKISDSMPVAKEVSFVVKKWKCPIIGASGMFSMITMPHKGLSVGNTDDFNTISEYLKNFGHFEPNAKGKGYTILGDQYDKISDFKDRIYGQKAFGDEVRAAIISFVREQNGIGDAE